MKKFFKKYLFDVLLVGSILLVSFSTLLVFHFTNKSNHLISKIYSQNDLLMTIDLSKEEEERHLTIQGYYTDVVIGVKKNSVCIIESGCPHQDCVHLGWVNKSGLPIVCTYNQVVVEILSNKDMDVEIGR